MYSFSFKNFSRLNILIFLENFFVFNIYLCKLELFFKKISKKYNCLKKSFRNKYQKTLKKKSNFQILKKKFFLNNIHYKNNALKKSTQNINHFLKFVTKKFKITYLIHINYNNNFLVGILSSKKLLIKIKKKIDNFMKIDLCLQIKKNILIIKNSKPIFFLDFYIKFKVKLKKIYLRKKIILNYKKRYINKIAFLNKKILNNFKIILIQIIYEHFIHMLNPLKIYKK
jgi:hypothetical protein